MYYAWSSALAPSQEPAADVECKHWRLSRNIESPRAQSRFISRPTSHSARRALTSSRIVVISTITARNDQPAVRRSARYRQRGRGPHNVLGAQCRSSGQAAKRLPADRHWQSNRLQRESPVVVQSVVRAWRRVGLQRERSSRGSEGISVCQGLQEAEIAPSPQEVAMAGELRCAVGAPAEH